VTNWLQIYAPAWFTFLSSSVILAIQVNKKSKSRFGEFVDNISAHNAELGLDRSVDEREIALDFLLPHRYGSIEEYTKRNNFSKAAYIRSLHEEVGKPVRLTAYLTVFGATLLCGFAGPVVYVFIGVTYLAEYLVGFLLLLLFSVVGYFYL